MEIKGPIWSNWVPGQNNNKIDDYFGQSEALDWPLRELIGPEHDYL